MSLGGLGRVRTERVVLFDEDNPLRLQTGTTLAPVEVAYETYGELDPETANAVFVCHALSGDAHTARHHGDPARRGWWDTSIGPDRPLDTERFFVTARTCSADARVPPVPRADRPVPPAAPAHGPSDRQRPRSGRAASAAGSGPP